MYFASLWAKKNAANIKVKMQIKKYDLIEV